MRPNLRSMAFWGPIGVIVLTTLGTLYAWYWGMIENQTLEPLLNALSILATLLFVAGTYLTIQQNQEDLREVKKDRERPLVRDELQHVLMPAVDAIEDDLQAINEGYADWSGAGGSRITNGFGRRNSIYLFNEPDRSAMHRLKETSPELYRDLEARDEMVKELNELGDEIGNSIAPYITELLEEDGPKPSKDRLFEGWVRTVQDAAIKELDYFGDEHALYDFWQRNGEKIIARMHENAGEKHSSLQRGVNELVEESESLRVRLIEEQMHLRRTYGISSQELQSAYVDRM